MMEYRKYYNKTHMPLNHTDRKSSVPPKKVTAGLSDAEYENLKKELYYQLTEYFSTFVSPDKLYDIVTSYIRNNSEMLRGDEGKPGEKGASGKDGASAYEIAVRNGFRGTEKEWLESLKPEVRTARIADIKLNTGEWTKIGENLYAQTVNIEGITEYSQVDLTPNVEQLATFYNKDLAFVTENDNGEVTVYAIGQKPLNDYTIQVTITEVTA
jgi:hypothetical protein